MNEKDRSRQSYNGGRPAGTKYGDRPAQGRENVNEGRNAYDQPRGQYYNQAPKQSHGQPDGHHRSASTQMVHSSGTAMTWKEKALIRREQRALQEKKENEKWSQGIQRVKGGPDAVFLVLLILIISIGVIMVYSASYPMAINEGESGFYYAGKQLLWVALGAGCMTIAALVPVKVYRKFAPVIYGLVAVLLLLVVFIGQTGGGAQRWLKITNSFGIQPSELAKFSLPVILAWYCEKNSHKFTDTLDTKQRFIHGVLIPSIYIIFYAFLIALEKHLSGLFIVSFIGVLVMFLAGAPKLLSGAYYGLGGAFGGLLFVVVNTYALQRIKTFLDSNADNLDENWQTYQGTLAIGSGGFLGLGLGQSRQKNSYVSEAQNDFIFTIWCEEMGFVGAVLVVLLFVALVYRGYTIALKAPDMFSSLVVFGIITQVGIQVILNLLVVTDRFMNTGISLPFLSYGGSSLIVLMAEMGVVLSVSKRSYVEKE